MYVTSHGNEEQMNKAKQFIVLPIIGLVIAILAWLIVVSVIEITQISMKHSYAEHLWTISDSSSYKSQAPDPGSGGVPIPVF